MAAYVQEVIEKKPKKGVTNSQGDQKILSVGSVA